LATYEAGKSHVLFGLRHSPPRGDRFLAGEIERAALYDRALTPEEIAALAGVASDIVTDDQIVASLSRDEARRYRDLQFELSRIRTESRLLAEANVCRVPAAPEATFVLSRGNPAQKEAAVCVPGADSIAAGCLPICNLPRCSRRRPGASAWADWITDIHNPLAPRVIVNRLWHYHFGTGIVDTPNDLGFNGGRPSHPELLRLARQRADSSQGRRSKTESESEIPNSQIPSAWSR